MRSRILTFLTIVAVLFFMPKRLLAQDRPAPIVEAVVGWSGFIDEAWDYFTTVGGGVRWFATPRLAIGPEGSYLSGKFEASSLIITHRQHHVRFHPRRRQAARRAVSGTSSSRQSFAWDGNQRRASR